MSRTEKGHAIGIDLAGGKKLCQSINPDEAVAYGAAAILSRKENGKLQDLTLLDATPITRGGDNHVNARFSIYEGESETILENNFLGDYRLCDIPPTPKGFPNFDVCFSIDASGILSVPAEDKSTGKNNGITINSNRKTFKGMEKMN
ncbi:hypothetical protein M0R45_027487 [Rubus argutus]|uniref:Heat shock protein 70 n=1 Tax=Rubus argutus TaxID=59490 RepID=A0AAW1X4D6_RUBAR